MFRTRRLALFDGTEPRTETRSSAGRRDAGGCREWANAEIVVGAVPGIGGMRPTGVGYCRAAEIRHADNSAQLTYGLPVAYFPITIKRDDKCTVTASLDKAVFVRDPN
jgi:hypothetical protein